MNDGAGDQVRWRDVDEDGLAPTARSLGTDIHIWCFRFSTDGKNLVRFTSALDDNEKARAKHFHFDRDRQHFVIRRGLQRKILAAYIGVDPQDITYREDRAEKPALVFSLDQPVLEFNASNSGAAGLLCVRRGGAVGIDLEVMTKQSALDLVAADNFTAAERAVLKNAGQEQWLGIFYRLWTQKEAALKAVGKGLSVSPRQIEATQAGEELIMTGLFDDQTNASRDWSVRVFTPVSGSVAALVTEGRMPALNFLRLCQNGT